MSKYTSTLTKGIVKENPVLRLVLGTCPTLAVSTAASNGIGMGLAATFVLVCSNIVISLLRKVIPDKVRLPAYIVVIAGFTTIVQMLLQAYVPSVYDMLGIYLPLIVVNCIILGRAEAFASKNDVVLSALDGIGMGIGFTAALTLMGAVRELLGTGSVFGWPDGGMFPGIFGMPAASVFGWPDGGLFPGIGIFVMPAGGFFVFGLMIWATNKLSRRFDSGFVPKASFSCEGCPHAVTCGKSKAGGGCDE